MARLGEFLCWGSWIVFSGLTVYQGFAASLMVGTVMSCAVVALTGFTLVCFYSDD